MKHRRLVLSILLSTVGLWSIVESSSGDAQPCARRCARDEVRDANGCCAPPRRTRTVRAPSCGEGRLLIPGGAFVMGTTHPVSLSSSQQDLREVTVPPYCIDRTEVTVAAYDACVARGRCTLPDRLHGCDYSEEPTKPQVCVTWDRAARFCEQARGRLPTEEEWEFAARGTDGREYPWGNAPPGDQLCWSGVTRRTELCAVGSFPNGASPYGVLDMAGNATEWTAQTFGLSPGPVHRVVHGGHAFETLAHRMLSALRLAEDPETHTGGLGFRCASDVRGRR